MILEFKISENLDSEQRLQKQMQNLWRTREKTAQKPSLRLPSLGFFMIYLHAKSTFASGTTREDDLQLSSSKGEAFPGISVLNMQPLKISVP